MSTRNGRSTKTPPVHQVRLGRVRAAIWEHATDNGARHNVTFSRLYKDEQDQWQDSTSFGRDDLPLLAKVADEVHSWLFQQNQNQNQKPSQRREEEIPF